MAGSTGSRLAAAAALVLILAVLLFHAFLWPRAAWQLLSAADRPLAERALHRGAAQIADMDPESYRWLARPVVSRSPGLVCVALLTKDPSRAGTYRACYDSRTGMIVEERISGPA